MNELVRHFLIETSPKGVKLKGCPNEPNFGEHNWSPPVFHLQNCSVLSCPLVEIVMKSNVYFISELLIYFFSFYFFSLSYSD